MVTILTESDIFAWGNEELKTLLQVQSTMFVDLGELAGKPGTVGGLGHMPHASVGCDE